MERKHVIIIGGGLAGIAAAVALARHRYQVTLLESRPRLGGRATSVLDPTTQDWIDNCQHVNMGCCVNFQQLCRWTDTDHYLTTEPTLYFVARDGRVNPLQNAWLPAPLNLAGSFLRFSYLNVGEKLSLAAALRSLPKAEGPKSGLFRDFLLQQRQSQRVIELFWEPVLVSALSEGLDRIAFGYGQQVFVDGFLKSRLGWQVQLLTVPLGEFYDDAICDWFARHGVEVRLKSKVTELQVSKDSTGQLRVSQVRLADGSCLQADDVIVSVTWDRVRSLLPKQVTDSEPFSQLSELESAPITSVHFWFDRPITPLRHVVLLQRKSQWLFNRSEILQQSTEQTQNRGYAYQVVISNSRELKQQVAAIKSEQEPVTQQELIDAVRAELAEIWPIVNQAQLRHARVITEHRAVFSVTPGVDQKRPGQQTVIPNLQLAGDWTATGWPATMEGACRSGFLAAEQVLQKGGLNEASLLAPELPADWLSSWILPATQVT